VTAQEELIAALLALDLDEERTAAGVRLAITVGRLAAISGADGAHT
jgi:hypothetical protein